MIKLLQYLLVVFFAFLCASSCTTSENSKNESEEDEAKLEETELPQPPQIKSTSADVVKVEEVKINGIYVTSINLPHSSYNFNNLFDEDENTYWSSMKGGGPDEGIMLYFDEPQSISHLKLSQFSGKEYALIETVEIYVNGIGIGEFSITEELTKINAVDASSLYIRIAKVASTNIFSAENDIYHSKFSPDKSVAVSTISFYNNNVKFRLNTPRLAKGSIIASSTLEPVSAYGVNNLMDSRKEFAWVEGAKDLGIGEVITIKLENPIDILGIKIRNGFQRSEKHFQANARLQQFKINDENGNESSVSVDDNMSEQTIMLEKPLTGKIFTIIVEKAYRGTSYEDLVVSEFVLLDKSGEIIVEDKSKELLKKELFDKVKGTILQDYLDTRILNEAEGEEYYSNSFVLRSDYTFVAYSTEYKSGMSNDQETKTIADGNWEIMELDANKVKIRVFGKLSNVSETYDYYNGNTKNSYLQIFQDFVIFEDGKFAGEKFLADYETIAKSE